MLIDRHCIDQMSIGQVVFTKKAWHPAQVKFSRSLVYVYFGDKLECFSNLLKLAQVIYVGKGQDVPLVLFPFLPLNIGLGRQFLSATNALAYLGKRFYNI
jgi:hypothetical protein